MEVGKVYYVSKGNLRPANKQYSTTNNDYEMSLDGRCEIEAGPTTYCSLLLLFILHLHHHPLPPPHHSPQPPPLYPPHPPSLHLPPTSSSPVSSDHFCIPVASGYWSTGDTMSKPVWKGTHQRMFVLAASFTPLRFIPDKCFEITSYDITDFM